MRTHIRKWGNSLALRIPRSMADELGWGPDTEVDLSAAGGKLAVTAAWRASYSLEELVAGITPENLTGTVEWGPPVGMEEW